MEVGRWPDCLHCDGAEPGRYGTDDEVSAEQEPPRLITTTTYLADGLGYVLDRPSKVFLLDVSDVASIKPDGSDLRLETATDLSIIDFSLPGKRLLLLADDRVHRAGSSWSQCGAFRGTGKSAPRVD